VGVTVPLLGVTVPATLNGEPCTALVGVIEKVVDVGLNVTVLH
jgi:hypothetical protein